MGWFCQLFLPVLRFGFLVDRMKIPILFLLNKEEKNLESKAKEKTGCLPFRGFHLWEKAMWE